MFEAFQFGEHVIVWTRLLFLLLGIWLLAEFFLRLALTANLSLQHFQETFWLYAIAFVLGGRAIAVLNEYKVYLKDPLRIFLLTDGDFSFLGGAIGIAILLGIATRGHRSTFLHWLDALVPATTLGLVFSWLGAFFSGEAYGRPANVWWGVTYDAMNVRYAVPIHPVQIYYALFYIVLTFLLLVVRKRAKRVGEETLIGIVSASVGTFLLESFRGDFGIPVFATKLDFALIGVIFLTLGIIAAVELRLRKEVFLLYEFLLIAATVLYVFVRPFLQMETYELRFSQLLSVLALLATIVYVVVQRRRYPYL